MHIAFGILNWGLGHATRSEPIIREALERGHQVSLLTWGNALSYCERSFPGASVFDLEGPEIRYGRQDRSGLGWDLIIQVLQNRGFIKKVRDSVQNLHRIKPIDRVYSDELPWIRIPGVFSVYMTHQLNIPVTWPLFWVNTIHRRWMRSYDEVWVPDRLSIPRLAGRLSDPSGLSGVKVRFVGWISRFQNYDHDSSGGCAIILSGPEPSRTHLEDRLIASIQGNNVILIRGIESETPFQSNGWRVEGRMHGDEFGTLIRGVNGVVTRSGYSSLMDLVILQKPAILIPTSGQGEQEYLADHVEEQGWFKVITEEEIPLEWTPEFSEVGLKANSMEDIADPSVLLSLLESKGKG